MAPGRRGVKDGRPTGPTYQTNCADGSIYIFLGDLLDSGGWGGVRCSDFGSVSQINQQHPSIGKAAKVNGRRDAISLMCTGVGRCRVSRTRAVSFFLCTGTAFGVWFGATHFARRNESAYPLSVPPELLNLGQVWQHATLQVKLPISNTTEFPVTVAGFDKSCGACTSIHPSSFILGPNATTPIALIIDLTRTGARFANAERYPLAIEISPQLRENSGSASIAPTWRIEATVIRALACTPSTANFGESVMDGRRSPTRKVHVHSRIPLSKLAVAGDTGRVKVAISRKSSASDLYEVNVCIDRDGLRGAFLVPVCLEGLSIAGERFRVSLPVVGTIVDDVRVVPSIVVLGDPAHTPTDELFVVVQSRTGIPLTRVEVVDDADSDILVTEVDRHDMPLHSFRITRRASGARTAFNSVRFRAYRSNGKEPMEVRLPIVCRPASSRTAPKRLSE